jgi:hypothetical protein
VKLLRLAILAVWALACTNPEGARKALESSGFTHIELQGFSMGCGKGDYSADAFTAINPIGKPVSGTVCCGAWMKGCTVRW